ncbi:low molecular weight protein-tyrosine-phosphatase [Streptococcus fryi]
MKKICFVCLGNICRSPMAEFVMSSLLEDRDWIVESRATSRWEHGNPIHQGTQAILRKYQIPYRTDKTSQQISQADLDDFDYILAMDNHNLDDLRQIANDEQTEKIFLFGEKSVPDPWYTGDFEETYSLVTKFCQDWIARIEGVDR